MSLSSTMTSLMDSARKHFEVTNKLSINNLINLFNPNPNLMPDAETFGKGKWTNMPAYSHSADWNGLEVISGTSNHAGVNCDYNVKAGETYTFSIYAKASVANFGASFHIVYDFPQSAWVVPVHDKAINIDTDWKRYSMTFTIKRDGQINPRVESDTPGTLYLAGYKLERGDLATPLQKVGGG